MVKIMPQNNEKNLSDVRIIDREKMAELVSLLAGKIVENNPNLSGITLVGIRNRGTYLAKRIAEEIQAITGNSVPVGIFDITLYRDDLRSRIDQPKLLRTEIPGVVEDRNIILVDDVLFTGRTIRAALNGIMDLGRARKVQLAVLVDRGHRELPIRANYTGQYVSTRLDQTIRVRFSEDGELDEVIMREV
jgi:pyrimidine operon attenuation protein/uracil phosphoribosyltransferase